MAGENKMKRSGAILGAAGLLIAVLAAGGCSASGGDPDSAGGGRKALAAAAITAFTINETAGRIDQEAKKIEIFMPSGANLDSLAPVVTFSGMSVSPASGETVSFSAGPVTYTVTAADRSVNTYTVMAYMADGRLSGLSVEGFSFKTPFDPDVTEYELEIEGLLSQRSLMVTAESAVESATMTYEETGAPVFSNESFEAKDFIAGGNTITVRVSAADLIAGEERQYKILFTYAGESAKLKDLRLLNGSSIPKLTPSFNSDTLEYTVKADDLNMKEEIKVRAETNSESATMVYKEGDDLPVVSKSSFAPKPVTVAANTITVVVSSSEGYELPYVIRIDFEGQTGDDDEAVGGKLLGLTATDGASSANLLTPEFSASVKEYRLSGPLTGGSLHIAATSEDQVEYLVNNKIEGAGAAHTQTVNANQEITVVVRVTANDGTWKNYKITARQANNETGLLGLSVDGNALDESVAEHSITVSNESISVMAKAKDPRAKVSYDEGNKTDTALLIFTSEKTGVGDNSVVTVVVTAEDGVTRAEYKINVRRNNSDVKLSGLTVTGAVLEPAFSPSVTTYTLAGPLTDGTMQVTAVKSDIKSKLSYRENGEELAAESTTVESAAGTFSYSNIAAGAMVTLVIRVAAEDGLSTRDYVITARRAGNNAALSALNVDGSALDFNPETLDYEVVTDNKTVRVQAVADNAARITYVDGSGDGKGILTFNSKEIAVGATEVVKIRVVAEDGVQDRVYTVSVRRVNTDATLSTLSVSDGEGVNLLSPSFSADVTTYNLSKPLTGDTLRITAARNNSTATLSYMEKGVTAQLASDTFNRQGIAKGETVTLIVRVRAENGFEKDYAVTARRVSDDAALSGLGVDGNVFNFDPDTREYSITVSKVPNVRVTAAARNKWAKISYSGNGSTETGTGTLVFTSKTIAMGATEPVIVRVVAESGENECEYKINVRRTNGDAELSSLVVTDGEESLENLLSPVFSAGTTTYSLSRPLTGDTLKVTAVKSNSAATLSYVENGMVTALTAGMFRRSSIAPGASVTVTVRVVAEDGETARDYSITARRIGSDTTLSSLSVEGAALNFKAGTFEYSMTVPQAGVINVAAAAKDANSKISYVQGNSTGVGSLSFASNTIAAGSSVLVTVRVTAENGDSRDYTIDVSCTAPQ